MYSRRGQRVRYRMPVVRRTAAVVDSEPVADPVIAQIANGIAPEGVMHPWVKIVFFLLPELRGNQNIEEEIENNIDIFPNGNTDTLFWNTLISSLEHAVNTKKADLSNFLNDKNPELFANCVFNTSLKIIFPIMSLFNWQLVRYRYFYLHVYPHKYVLHFSGEEVLFQMEKGYADWNVEDMRELAKIIKLMRAARIAALWMKIHGPAADFEHIQTFSCCLAIEVRATNLEPNEYLKPNEHGVVDIEAVKQEKELFRNSRYQAPDPPNIESIGQLVAHRHTGYDIQPGSQFCQCDRSCICARGWMCPH